MATLTEIRNKANAVLIDFWNALQTKQTAYYNKHAKYFQLLAGNSVVDGVDTQFVVIHPYDERHSVDVDFTFNTLIPFQISVTEWVWRDEAGYSATVTVELLDGRKYTRTRHSTGEDTDWYELLEPSIS